MMSMILLSLIYFSERNGKRILIADSGEHTGTESRLQYQSPTTGTDRTRIHGYSAETRCVLYAKNAGMKLVLRTSLKDEIYPGGIFCTLKGGSI